MAKMRGPAMSGFSGKVGNLVGRKQIGGGYIVSAYQPSVYNPSTEGQRVGRSAIALLGQLASRFGRGNLIGLRDVGRSFGGNWFSAFVRENYRQVIWSESSQISTLNLPGLVLSRGVGANPVDITLELTYSDGNPENLEVAFSLPSGVVADDVIRQHVVAMVYDATPTIISSHQDGFSGSASFYVGDPAGRPSPWLNKNVYVWVYLETRLTGNDRTAYYPNRYQQQPDVVNPTETTPAGGTVFGDSVYGGTIILAPQQP